MKHERRSYASNSSRFDASLRHYHKPARGHDSDWDDWIGDKAKGPLRARLDRALHAGIKLSSWCLATAALLFVMYFFWSKILPMLGK